MVDKAELLFKDQASSLNKRVILSWGYSLFYASNRETNTFEAVGANVPIEC